MRRSEDASAGVDLIAIKHFASTASDSTRRERQYSICSRRDSAAFTSNASAHRPHQPNRLLQLVLPKAGRADHACGSLLRSARDRRRVLWSAGSLSVRVSWSAPRRRPAAARPRQGLAGFSSSTSCTKERNSTRPGSPSEPSRRASRPKHTRGRQAKTQRSVCLAAAGGTPTPRAARGTILRLVEGKRRPPRPARGARNEATPIQQNAQRAEAGPWPRARSAPRARTWT